MKHQITAYFSVLYTSASINHFLYERANGYSRHCMSGQKTEIVENNRMKITFCTEGPIEITICVCLILRLYEINVGFF